VRLPSVSGLERTQDFLWDTTDIAIWSTVEVGIGISAGCAATLRPLMHAIFKSNGWRSHISARISSGRGAGNGSRALTPGAKTGEFTNLSSNLSRSRSQRAKSPLPFHRSASLRAQDAFRPDKVGNTTTVTSVTPPNRSRSDTASSEELWLGADPSTLHYYGIAKTKDVQVTFETTELRDIEATDMDIEKRLPSLPDSQQGDGSQPSSVFDRKTWLSDRSSERPTPSQRPSFEQPYRGPYEQSRIQYGSRF
jgi:hypothetical protein